MGDTCIGGGDADACIGSGVADACIGGGDTDACIDCVGTCIVCSLHNS
jgi:hypothetical protein